MHPQASEAYAGHGPLNQGQFAFLVDVQHVAYFVHCLSVLVVEVIHFVCPRIERQKLSVFGPFTNYILALGEISSVMTRLRYRREQPQPIAVISR